MKPVVALVDPFTSGRIYTEAFQTHGAQCVMVDSGRCTAQRFRSGFDIGAYTHRVTHHGEIAETAEQLRALGVTCVVAGGETGVPLTDALAETLKLPGNGVDLSRARREKDAMATRVQAIGAAPASFGSGDLDALLGWVDDHARFPVVFKPTAATGSDGVTLCDSNDDVRRAFTKQSTQRNILGQENQGFMVQEYIEGDEYVIDTVSCAGAHRLAAFWRYLKPKNPRRFVGYDGIELLAADSAQAQTLIDTTYDVLHVLGVQHGPAHTEMFWSNGRAVHVETGCRPHGGDNPRYAGRCLGVSQPELAALAYLDPPQFAKITAAPYRLKAHTSIVFLRPSESGVLRDLSDLEPIRSLASCDGLFCSPEIGKPITPIVGIVYLIHPEKGQVDADLASIRAYEQDGLYHIEQEAEIDS